MERPFTFFVGGMNIQCSGLNRETNVYNLPEGYLNNLPNCTSKLEFQLCLHLTVEEAERFPEYFRTFYGHSIPGNQLNLTEEQSRGLIPFISWERDNGDLVAVLEPEYNELVLNRILEITRREDHIQQLEEQITHLNATVKELRELPKSLEFSAITDAISCTEQQTLIDEHDLDWFDDDDNHPELVHD